jgi:hypothetical protein
MYSLRGAQLKRGQQLKEVKKGLGKENVVRKHRI